MRVLVTGASGFIGTHLLPLLVSRGHEVVAASRRPVRLNGIVWHLSPELSHESDWSRALEGVDAVVHLAARSQIRPASGLEECLYRRINTEGTARLAKQAADAGVRHFLFLSSVHAVAAESDGRITEHSEPRPVSDYGRSKLAAEKALRGELRGTPTEWTILRPPVVYGNGNNTNFGLLLNLVKLGVPLPLSSVRNRRSLLYIENLVDLIALCLGNQKAFGKIFLPSDGQDVSTPDLIRAIARANQSVGCSVCSDSVAEKEGGHFFDRRGNLSAVRSGSRHSPILFPLPEGILRAAGCLPGLGALRKLTGSLYVDSEPLSGDLGWTAPFTMGEALRRLLVSI